MMSLGYKIRQLRKESNLTQKELGQKLNIGKSTISQYENDINVPDIDMLSRIAEIFNVSLDYLLNRTNNKTSHTDSKNPELTKKDKRDIAKDLENIMNDIDDSGGLTFYNEPLDELDKELLKNALNHALENLKIKNKEKYTPKKYKNK